MNIQKLFWLTFIVLLLVTNGSYGFEVKIKVFLEGPLQDGNMSTFLVHELKKSHPQTPNEAVDIIEVEIRMQLQGNAIESKKAFLLKDGTVLDFHTLQSNLTFSSTNNAYYVVVKHRNHLPIASKNLITHQSVCDLTLPHNIYGETKIIQGKAVMIAGNVYNDSQDMNEINASDYFVVSKAKDLSKTGYIVEDINLDGVVNEKDLQIVKNHSEKLYFSQIQ